MNTKGRLFCVVGPSGSGKSSICRLLLGNLPLGLSISYTTRQPRGAEVNGKDYHFLTTEDFMAKVSSGFFAEHAKFGDNYYGTGHRDLNVLMESGKDVLLDIEYQGVRQLKEKLGDDVVSIFIFPPSFAELESRLRNRGTDSDESIKKRLSIAATEIEALLKEELADYFVENRELQDAYELCAQIIGSEKHRINRSYANEIRKKLLP